MQEEGTVVVQKKLGMPISVLAKDEF